MVNIAILNVSYRKPSERQVVRDEVEQFLNIV